MFRLVKKSKKSPITLRNHFNRRNKVLIKRRTGGFGDILMQRMLFEDFSKTELQFTHACPYNFIDFAKNHPCSKHADINTVNEEEFGNIIDITTCCRVYETMYAPTKTHRSDIWAEYCGIKLKNHNMFLETSPEIKKKCKTYFDYINPHKKLTVLLATQSTDDDFGIGKSLNRQQIKELVYNIKKMGLLPISIHNKHQEIYESLDVFQIISPEALYWMGIVSEADYIISIDTATFHLAGGLKKPLIGVFGYTDGKTYGKYFDFILIQRHRDDGNWDCGPCFMCNICPKNQHSPQKPCLSEVTADEITIGLCKALKKWPVTKNE